MRADAGDPNLCLTAKGGQGMAEPNKGGARRARGAKDLGQLVRALQSEPRWRTRFERWQVVPPRLARLEPFPEGLDPRLVELFQKRGIRELYEHQARFVRHALAGEDVLVATPTASGKTLCYTLPVLQRAARDAGGARDRCSSFPTKALEPGPDRRC